MWTCIFFAVSALHERQVSVDRMPLCHCGDAPRRARKFAAARAHLNSCFCFIFVKGLNEVKTIAEEGWVCVPRCAHHVRARRSPLLLLCDKELFCAMNAFKQKNQTLERVAPFLDNYTAAVLKILCKKWPLK
jgi:hypothetical protein